MDEELIKLKDQFTKDENGKDISSINALLGRMCCAIVILQYEMQDLRKELNSSLNLRFGIPG